MNKNNDFDFYQRLFELVKNLIVMKYKLNYRLVRKQA